MRLQVQLIQSIQIPIKQMYQKWQKVLFLNLIDDLMSKISEPSLNWFQFSLVIREGNIKFRGLSEQLKFRKYFQDKQFVDKDVLRKIMDICETMVTNNKKVYVIKMRESPEKLLHLPVKCFAWWKEFMLKKYGPDLKWFDSIAFKKDTFKIKSFDFKQNLNRILTGTEHQKCSEKICSFFPKVNRSHINQNQKNEIQFSIFLNTIKVSSQSTHWLTFSAKKSQSQSGKAYNSTISKFSQNESQKIQRVVTQTSETCYVTEWNPNEFYEERNEKRENNHMKGRFFKKHRSKTINSFYSVSIKESIQKQKFHKRNQSLFNNNSTM